LQSLTRIASPGCALFDEVDFSLCRPDSSSGTVSSNPCFGPATASAPPPGSPGSHCPLIASPSAIVSYVSFDSQGRYNTADPAPLGAP